MPGPAGADDLALQRAKPGHLAPHAWQNSWHARPQGSDCQVAAQAGTDSTRPEPAECGSSPEVPRLRTGRLLSASFAMTR